MHMNDKSALKEARMGFLDAPSLPPTLVGIHLGGMPVQ